MAKRKKSSRKRNTPAAEAEAAPTAEHEDTPPIEGEQWFRKGGTRAAQAISKIVMAAVRAPRPRIALGSVAPTVVRLPRTEEALASGASIEEAQRVLEEEIRPIDDVRSTATYRRRVAANLLGRWWGVEA
jgi:CO/xanthine dehydrogenase FAD-binding subunit